VKGQSKFVTSYMGPR